MKADIEDSLLDRAAVGDRAACAVLIDHYKSFVFNLAFKVLRNQEDAEEVAQDSFVKAFRHLDKFDRRAKFSTWLYRIAYNTALTHARKKKLVARPIQELKEWQMPASDRAGGYQLLAEQQQKKAVHDALEILSAEDRALMVLYYLEEQSMEEIAEITGISKGNVKIRVHRARKKLLERCSHLLKGALDTD